MRQLVSSTGKPQEKKEPVKKVQGDLLDVKKNKDGTTKGSQTRRSAHTSMIPKLKLQKNEVKGANKKPVSPPKMASSLSRSKNPGEYRESPQARAKSIVECYSKIEDFIHKVLGNSEGTGKKTKSSPSARKMISDTLVFNKDNFKNDARVNFNPNTKDKISQVWVSTTTGLSGAFKVLESKQVSSPVDGEMENLKMQVGIKQAKSLTLIKTKNMIEEAKELLLRRKLIRKEIENLIGVKKQEEKKEEEEEEEKMEEQEEEKKEEQEEEEEEEKEQSYWDDEREEKEENTNIRSAEDTSDRSGEETSDRSGEDTSGCSKEDSSDGADSRTLEIKRKEADDKGNQVISFVLVKDVNLLSAENEEGRDGEEQTEPATRSRATSTQNMMHIYEQEIAKKNETITHLNSKIFELQKAHTESTIKCSQLQGKVAEFQGKIQWSHVLWKQIGKLKERIRGLQKNNLQLESQKRELQSKVGKLDGELERLMKANQTSNRKQYLLVDGSSGESIIGSDSNLQETPSTLKKNVENGERILAEKQNMIQQLMNILGEMKDQEYAAQKQIFMFKSKIEELEKDTL